MQRKKVQPQFTRENVKMKSFTMWDVTHLNAAMRVVLDPQNQSSTFEVVKDVKDKRNDLFHRGELSVLSQDFEESVKTVQKLIDTLPCPSIPKEVCDRYLEEMHSLTSSELQLCHIALSTALKFLLWVSRYVPRGL